VELIFERGDYAEIAASAAQTPEKVCILGGIYRQQLALGGDEIDGEEIVAGEAVFAGKPAKAASKRKSGNTGAGDRAPRGCEAKCLGLAIEVRPGSPALGAHRVTCRIDSDAAHAAKIDH
jgi:hypothetical protein